MSDIESNDRPKWLSELENRKRKPRLAHEAGAGAPCVICKAACPGLDLHFWRKICKNCKCNKDDHDVDDEDFPQFDLLLGSLRKYKKKRTLLHMNNEKGYAEEAFEWIPPDTTKELATDYMKALPVEKLPIKGSVGAALRRQLLHKQLPLHDIDHKVCDELSDQEKKEFEKYLENIKKYVGQGTVTKILTARPYNRSLMTPANATDMQHSSPQHKVVDVQSNMIQLRTPSSFAPKCSYRQDLYENLKKHDRSLETLNNSSHIKTIPVLEKYNLIGNNSTTVKSESIENGLYNKGICPTSVSTNNSHRILNSLEQHCIEGCKDQVKSPASAWSFSCSEPINNDAYIAENILAETLLPSSTATRNNEIIGSTLDKKGLMFIREKLTTKYSKQENQGQVPYNAPSFSRDLNSSDLLAKNDSTLSRNVHIINGTDKTAVPLATNNHSETPNVSEDKIIEKTEKNIPESTLIKAEQEIIKPTSQVIRSTANDVVSICNTNEKENFKENTLLTPTSKITNNNSLFNNSLASSSRMHRCLDRAEFNSFVTPSTVIHSEELQNQIFPYKTIGGVLNQPIQDLENVEHLKGAMKELSIEESVDSQKCHKCEEEIRVGDVAIITEKTKNTAWHPGCFVCSTCNELLVDLVYFYYKNKLYCGRDLATLLGIPRCFACDELIFVREYTVAEGHNYHVKHFCCWDCDVPLAGKQYITENDRPLCLPCYQKTYAKTCNTCEKVIAADQQGVAVKDLNFHATELCFCCYICKKNLLYGKIAVKEKKLFCSKECISKFLHV